MPRHRLRLALYAMALMLMVLVAPLPLAAQSPAPTDATAPLAEVEGWPTGDELRRELQDIGFAFRIDRATGHWLGWAARATLIEAPAITLGADGAEPAWARTTFQTLEVDLLGRDVDGALTAFMEVASRTPLPIDDVRTAFVFLTEVLLVEAPVLQQECYATTSESGVIIFRLDTETGEANVLLARSPDAHPDGYDIVDCAPISVAAAEPETGSSRSERVTLTITSDGSIAPSETTVEGGLVTLVLTFRNDSDEEQSLTFAPPLEADTGPVAPGESVLIVIRRLVPGDYAYSSSADPDTMLGVIRVIEPTPD